MVKMKVWVQKAMEIMKKTKKHKQKKLIKRKKLKARKTDKERKKRKRERGRSALQNGGTLACGLVGPWFESQHRKRKCL
jgi:hypothetical protein